MTSSFLDHPLVSERYFFPRPGKLSDPFVVKANGVQLHCHLSTPNTNAPLLLHFHGNGELVSDWLYDFEPALIKAGFNVCLAEYRGYGSSSGDPALVAMLDDALVIADACGVEPQQMYVYGRSVGSIYALHVAANRAVAGLIIESGIANVLQRLAIRVEPQELGVSQAELEREIATHLNHESKIQAHRGKLLVMHTRRDQLVPASHAQQLADWAGSKARLVLFEQGDHNSIHLHNGPAIVAELERLAFNR